MLNPSFPRCVINFEESKYQLPPELWEKVISNNKEFKTGEEFRLQKVFGYEVWNKLGMLGLDKSKWENKKILELSGGTGFLTFHLLQRIKPDKYIFNDISVEEIKEAKVTISKVDRNKVTKVKFIHGDLMKVDFPENYFDIICGNSFLHHIPDIPESLRKIHKLLKPGGKFVCLHEPVVASVALESSNIKAWILASFFKEKYIEMIRRKGKNVSENYGSDVWIFKNKDLERLLFSAKFAKVNIKNIQLLRPIVVSQLKLHLTPRKKSLTSFEVNILESAINLDSKLSQKLQSNIFGSVAFTATK